MPLNVIINHLEIALEGSLEEETRDSLAKSHSASKSLIYVINNLLDLTMAGEGREVTKNEVFDLKSMLEEATDMFAGDTHRKETADDGEECARIPTHVVGDGHRVRQAISNVTANAIQNTSRWQSGMKRLQSFGMPSQSMNSSTNSKGLAELFSLHFSDSAVSSVMP